MFNETTQAALGAAIRKKLEEDYKGSLKTFLDQMIETGLPKLQSGSWEGEKFVPKPGAEKFTFPRNADEKEAADLSKEWEQIETEAKLKAEITDTVEIQFKFRLNRFLERTGARIAKDSDRLVQKLFGCHALGVKKFFNKVCEFAFWTVLGSILKVLLWPVDKVFWFAVKKYLHVKAEQMMENAQMPIHENAYYQIFDAILKRLKKPNPSTP